MPGGALNLISTNYPDHGHHGRLPLSRKNAHGGAGIEPGTSRLVVRSSDHQATRLVIDFNYVSVSQTVVRGPQVVLGFCPCGPFRLNISPKKTEKIKLT